MAFHEVLLPDSLAYGAKFGPVFMTTIVTSKSGREQRVTSSGRPRRQGTVGYSVQSKSNMDALLAFFIARAGKLHGFRFSDQNDRLAMNAPAVSAGGSLLQLQTAYTSGGVTATRTITKPSQAGPFTLYQGGAMMAGGYALDTTTGIVTLSAAPSGVYTWSGPFDTPVRFDADAMEITRDDFDLRSWSGIPIIEILL